jgi:hypothetical protein
MRLVERCVLAGADATGFCVSGTGIEEAVAACWPPLSPAPLGDV